MTTVPPKTEDAYLWVALASGLVFFFIPLAIHRLIKSEIDFDFKALRPELYDVLQGLYSFFGWCGLISLTRCASRFMYGYTSTALGLSLNAGRLAAGLWLIYLVGCVFAKQGKLGKWEKQKSLQAELSFPSGPREY